jgi:hypothetical protein
VSEITLRVEVHEVFAAAATVMYDLVTDLTRMGDWSPENLGSEWIEGEPAALGSRFMGRNRRDDVEWEGGGIVIAATRPHEFAWIMGDDPRCPRGTWRYLFRADGRLTHVTETYELGPGDSGFREMLAGLSADDCSAALDVRRAQLQSGMRLTLARLKS